MSKVKKHEEAVVLLREPFVPNTELIRSSLEKYYPADGKKPADEARRSLEQMLDRFRQEGAAVAFGLMGMALAIQQRVLDEHYDPLCCIHGMFTREPCAQCDDDTVNDPLYAVLPNGTAPKEDP